MLQAKKAPKKNEKHDARKLAMNDYFRREEEAQAENRRKLLATLSPEAAELVRREFANLGLYQ